MHRRELQREKAWSRIHLVPLLLAESDRDVYRRDYAALEREREIMKDVPGWEVRFCSPPLYHLSSLAHVLTGWWDRSERRRTTPRGTHRVPSSLSRLCWNGGCFAIVLFMKVDDDSSAPSISRRVFHTTSFFIQPSSLQLGLHLGSILLHDRVDQSSYRHRPTNEYGCDSRQMKETHHSLRQRLGLRHRASRRAPCRRHG